jgi:hypothetical protein
MFILKNRHSILRIAIELLPLFTGIICAILLALALVPGRLAAYLDIYTNEDSYLFWIGYLGAIPFCFGLGGLVIYEVIKLLRRQHKLRQLSGIFTILLIVITKLALSLDLPARLYFYAQIQQLEKALAHRASSDGSKNFYVQTRNFVPINSPNGVEQQFGFAYLHHPSKTYYQVTRIYGNWYIFSGTNWQLIPGPNWSFDRGE